jgi:molybdopterin-containing oxidoreductase family iron-sulfur binding subunit
LLSLTGLTGTFYDYIKANAGTLITGSTWNQVFMMTIYVGVASAASASSADYSAAANALAKAKAASGLELVLYTKTGMGDGQQANNPWLQEFPIQYKSFWDNYVTVSNADAKKYELLMKLLLMVD